MEEMEKQLKKGGRRGPRVAAWVLGGILGLVFLVLLGVSLFLTPERLTGLVNKYAGEYFVNADFRVERAELTVWRTFPHAEIEVEGLRIVNTDPTVPAEGDTVATVENFHGRINLAALLIGRISVNQVTIDRPCATFWQGPDSLTNLNIFPPSEPEEEKDEPLSLPSIHLDKFRILGDARFRYISAPDSINADVTIRATELSESDGVSQYVLTTSASAGAMPFLPERLKVGLDGGISWEPNEPLALGLNKFKVDVDSIRTETTAELDFSDGVLVKSLDFKLNPLSLQRVSELIEQVPALETPAAMELTAKLMAPYKYNPDTLLMPAMEATLTIKEAPMAIPAYHLNLTKLALSAEAKISPEGLDRSEVDLKNLRVAFPASDFKLTAKATNLLADPHAEGCFRGAIDFNNLDRRIWQLLGMRLRGALDADLDFNLNLSDLTANTFHRARLDGEMTLDNFVCLMPTDSIAAWTRKAHLEFGSREQRNDIDSLLAASLTLDTARIWTADLQAEISRLKMNLGVENRAQTADTTTVTPMGGRLEIGSVRCLMADSSRAMLRGMSGATVLTRYQGDGKRPLMAAKFGVDRAVYSDGVNRLSLSGAEIAAKAHLAQTSRRERRTLTAADSMRLHHRRDSLILSDKGHERMDFGVDRSMVRTLKKWDVRGQVKARRARMFTPLFPLRMRLTDLNLGFNPDSVVLNSLALNAGSSDFRLNGLISNMQKSLGSRRGQPLRLALTLNSDTINVNEITRAAFRGAAWQAKADSLITARSADLNLDDNALEAQAEAEENADDAMRAIVVPMNIDASFDFHARNIVYSTMLLHDFSGEVIVADGAAQLSDLYASTDIGSASANLIYYAPTIDDIDIGLSAELTRFRIDKVTQMIPALDSILPLLNDLGGVIDVNIGATTRTDSLLNVDFPSLRAMVSLTGDSLKVLDEQTFKTVSKWLLFRDKKKNMIDRMEVELAIEDNMLEIYPFMFDFDRYRIGVMGHNDLDMNMDYHVSILKSPIPFKFGINIKGTPEKMKIRPGLARFKEKMAGQRTQLADTLRVNLAKEIKGALKKGAKAARVAPMGVARPDRIESLTEATDTLSRADSLYFIEHGLIEAPDSLMIKKE